MASIGYATLQVIPSLKGFNQKLRLGMSGSLGQEGAAAGQTAGKSFASTFAKFAVVGAAATGAVAIGKSFVDAAVESEKVGRQTAAVLKSMGGEAGLTAKDIANLAEKQSMLSGVDDEVIQSAQNVLLTFGKVRNEVGKGNDVFNRGSQAALDMSVALKTDLQGATIQIGKALNDPIKGITALSRAGVSFTQQQKDQIVAMTKSGDVLGAQKLILKELENQFGGSAAAQATAGERLKVVIGNLQEQFGKYLLPVVEKVAAFLADNLPAAMEFAGRTIAPLVDGIQAFFYTLTSGFTEDEGTPIERFALRVRGAFESVVEWVQRNWPQIQKIGETVLAAVGKAGEILVGVLGKLLPVLGKFAVWVTKNKPLLAAIATVIAGVLVNAVVAWTVATWAQVAALTAQAVAFAAANAPLIAIIAGIAALAAGVVYAYEHFGAFRAVVDAVVGFIRNVVVPGFQFLLDKIMGVIAWVADNWPLLLAIITGPIGLAVKFVVDHFDAIKTAISAVKDFITNIAGTLWDGLKSGLTSVANFIIGGLERILNSVIGLVNGAIRAYNKIPLAPNIGTVDEVKLGRFGGSDKNKGTSRGDLGVGLAGGGIIKAIPGGVFANLGEGRFTEAVLPLSASGLAPFAAALAPRITGQGMAMDLSVSVDPAGGESAFLTWLLKALRVRPAAARQLASAR